MTGVAVLQRVAAQLFQLDSHAAASKLAGSDPANINRLDGRDVALVLLLWATDLKARVLGSVTPSHYPIGRESVAITADIFDLSGRVAVVTGGGRGFGRTFALGLARYGAAVGILGIDFELAESAKTEVEALGGGVIARRTDSLVGSRHGF